MNAIEIRDYLVRDKGILGIIARHPLVDKTPMRDRLNGNGPRLSRREFVILAADSSLLVFLTSCIPGWVRGPLVTATSSQNGDPTPPHVDLGIQTDKVKVLSEAEAVAEGVSSGVSPEVVFDSMVSEFSNSVNHPDINVSQAQIEKFAIQVPVMTMQGQENYLYPFVSFKSPPEGDSFVAMAVNVKVNDVMNLRAVTLVPENIDFGGKRLAALVIRKNPLNGSDLSKPLPVFVFPVDLQTWRGMNEGQQNNASIIFVPYGLSNNEDIKLPMGGKLAVPIAFIRQVTEEPPTATKPATPTNTPQNTPKPPTESAPPATPIPPEVPTPFTEADGIVRPDFIPSNSYYIGSEHWVTPPTLNDCRAGRENDPKFQLDPQFVYSDTAPATDKYPPGVYFECEFSGTGLNKVTITTVK